MIWALCLGNSHAPPPPWTAPPPPTASGPCITRIPTCPGSPTTSRRPGAGTAARRATCPGGRRRPSCRRAVRPRPLPHPLQRRRLLRWGFPPLYRGSRAMPTAQRTTPGRPIRPSTPASSRMPLDSKSGIHRRNVYSKSTAHRGQIHESTISLRFQGIILFFFRLEGSSFGFGFLKYAIHEQTLVFFIAWLFCMDFWNHWGIGFSNRFSSFLNLQSKL